MKTKLDLHRLVEELPENEVEIAGRYLEYLRNMADPALRYLLEAPMEEEELSPEMLQSLDEAKKQALEGQGRPWEEVRREMSGD